MNKIFATIVAFGQVYLLFPLMASAAVPTGLSGANTGLTNIATSANIQNSGDLTVLIGKGINVILGLLGILFLIFVLYAGFLYLTAQGADEPVKKAKKLLTNSIIGLVIIIAAYAISNYVIGALTSITSAT
ncbi:MAG: hypothetical protein WC702_03555 [Patescibacteria group bacterium]|jgi:hypothetical protein